MLEISLEVCLARRGHSYDIRQRLVETYVDPNVLRYWDTLKSLFSHLGQMEKISGFSCPNT